MVDSTCTRGVPRPRLVLPAGSEDFGWAEIFEWGGGWGRKKGEQRRDNQGAIKEVVSSEEEHVLDHSRVAKT